MRFTNKKKTRFQICVNSKYSWKQAAALIQHRRIMGTDADSKSQIFLIRSFSLQSDSVCFLPVFSESAQRGFFFFFFNHFLLNSNEPLLEDGSISSQRVGAPPGSTSLSAAGSAGPEPRPRSLSKLLLGDHAQRNRRLEKGRQGLTSDPGASAASSLIPVLDLRP